METTTNLKEVVGSISDVANSRGMTEEQILLEVKHMILIDTSASMSDHDGTEKSRNQKAFNELQALQGNLPGKIAVISFSDDVKFCSNGIPHIFDNGTNFRKALEFIKNFDGLDIKFYLISDGEDSNDYVPKLAAEFVTPIDCIFIGSDKDYNSGGREVLKKISEASRGKLIKSDEPGHFQKEILALMEGK